MTKRAIAIGSAIAFLALPSFAFAAPSPVATLFTAAPPGTVGPFISGVIYGNTSNPSGNGNGVLPSFSPGPWVCGSTLDCSGPTNPGGSVGDGLAPLASGGAGTPDFANGNDQDIDFSLH